MKYGELIDFQPVQTVKQLRDADDPSKAAEDVRTFVISERMADQLRDVTLPNLQFASQEDNKGLLVVGNYGTGKTHLMSVLAAVAEHSELADEITRQDMREPFKSIAGQFRVIRAELGATRMALRDAICAELTKGLAQLDVPFEFPPADKVTNNKDALGDMMAAFDAKHPGKGLLFVLDELLDYLRRRRDAELVEDLQFLRELGEVAANLRFRVIAGIQEALFDNPYFNNVASDVHRVRDRFIQVRIVTEDISYVVKERLLRKNVTQRDRIREHLQPFTPLYDGMAEDLEEFVDLFPVHPAFLRTFPALTLIEKREVLKTLSGEMQDRLDQDVPEDEPGVFSYDIYRARMADDPSVRAIPEVREVLEKSDVLLNRVMKAMPTPAYVPTAQRVIKGLSVHRLTTEDVYAPIGATIRELCGDLCLLPEGLAERDAVFLEQVVGTVVEEMIRAVSGQFISENPDNGQLYLDLYKDIDYDQKIEDRAASLDDDKLDAAYYDALESLLELRDAPYVSGYRIWEYELPWEAKRVGRLGYLFMGAPNERSTATPPRDFYLYFLQPYARPSFVDQEEPDEVLLDLVERDDEFTGALRHYAGARALAIESASNRAIYEEKTNDARRRLSNWLKANMGTAVHVTHRGETKPLAAWVPPGSGATTVKAQIDASAAATLSDHFDTRYPGYPTFAVTVTRENLEDTVKAALARLASGRSTKAGDAVLESLGLLDIHGAIRADGEYAEHLLTQLAAAGGKVLNASDLLTGRDKGVRAWEPWFLEPSWLVVVAAALCQIGRLDLGYPAGRIDALSLDRLARMSLNELESLSHLAPPKALPLMQLREVADLLGLPTGSVRDTGADEGLVTAVLAKVADLQQRVVSATQVLNDGLDLWGAGVLEQADERHARLAALSAVLADLRARNTTGKLNHLDLDATALTAARDGASELSSIEDVREAHSRLAGPAAYLREAADVFGSGFELTDEASALRERMLDLFRDGDAGDATKVTATRSDAEDLRRRFAEEAERSIEHDTLDGPGDDRKARLLSGSLYRDMKALAAVTLLPDGPFGSIEHQLLDLPVCKDYDPADLLTSVVPPGTAYRPRPRSGPSAAARLSAIETDLQQLYDNWERTLVESLAEPELQERVALLPPKQETLIRGFVEAKTLPSPVDEDFVRAVNQVLEGFDVRPVTPTELWRSLFPDGTAATVAELRARFEAAMAATVGGANEAKVRIVPTEEEE